MLKYLKRLGREQQGQTMAEFALVLPVMVIFLIASLEFGWYFLNYNAVTQYTRDTLSCVPSPQGELYWNGGDWKDITVSTPSWTTPEDFSDRHGSAYDGWIAFDDQSAYFYPSFEEGVRGIPTILNKDQIEVTSVKKCIYMNSSSFNTRILLEHLSSAIWYQTYKTMV